MHKNISIVTTVPLVETRDVANAVATVAVAIATQVRVDTEVRFRTRPLVVTANYEEKQTSINIRKFD